MKVIILICALLSCASSAWAEGWTRPDDYSVKRLSKDDAYCSTYAYDLYNERLTTQKDNPLAGMSAIYGYSIAYKECMRLRGWEEQKK